MFYAAFWIPGFLKWPESLNLLVHQWKLKHFPPKRIPAYLVTDDDYTNVFGEFWRVVVLWLHFVLEKIFHGA